MELASEWTPMETILFIQGCKAQVGRAGVKLALACDNRAGLCRRHSHHTENDD